MLPLLLTLIAPAQAEEPARQLTLSTGLSALMGDPYVNRAGFQLGAELGPVPWFSLGARAGFTPDLGDGDWSTLIVVGDEEPEPLPPDLSQIAF